MARIGFLLMWTTALVTSTPFCLPGQSAVSPEESVRDLNTPRAFPAIHSRSEWEARANQIRQQILVSCGLWPSPAKTPLDAHIFGRIERDGYTVEKVYFRTFPGFYLAGNLYRPGGHGRGPFPAILNPHGHWAEGRLTDNKDCSISARCINFARQGMIAFAYDMVGYNDTHFADSPADRPFSEAHHEFATNRADLLWDINLMGLQTWNSIRALDFLESLPDVDPNRLACTGESGGGTQTFMLGAVDRRLAAQAPVVMVSHLMQGGCLCENAPGLRVEYSNMEIDAAAAPRPQIIVGATGDWTRDTLKVEGPAIAHIYQLLMAPDRFHYVKFDFGHNYNQTSREAVYAWFDQWLLKRKGAVKETSYEKEQDSALRVFPDGRLPSDALTQDQFIAQLRALHRASWEKLLPQDASGLNRFKATMFPAWRHILLVDWPGGRTEIETEASHDYADHTESQIKLRRLGSDQTITARYFAPANLSDNPAPKLVVLSSTHPESNVGTEGHPASLVISLLRTGAGVLVPEKWSTAKPGDQFANFYTTYNRTELQERVRDLLTICSSAESLVPGSAATCRVILWGQGETGIWALLAAPGADAIIADGAGLGRDDEQAWLAPELFCPGILNLGGYQTALMLAAPHPLLLYHTGQHPDQQGIRAAYAAAHAEAKLRMEAQPPAEKQAIEWLSRL